MGKTGAVTEQPSHGRTGIAVNRWKRTAPCLLFHNQHYSLNVSSYHSPFKCRLIGGQTLEIMNVLIQTRILKSAGFDYRSALILSPSRYIETSQTPGMEEFMVDC